MFDLELDKAVEQIKEKNAMTVCVQLPDGLKPMAKGIQLRIEEETEAKVYIWAGSCYGACDTPDLKEVDLLIQWGHSEWI